MKPVAVIKPALIEFFILPVLGFTKSRVANLFNTEE